MRVAPSPLPSSPPSSLPPTAAGLAGGVERVACFPTHLPRRLWRGGGEEVAVRREQGGAGPRAGEQVQDARMFRAHAAARAAAAGCPVPPPSPRAPLRPREGGRSHFEQAHPVHCRQHARRRAGQCVSGQVCQVHRRMLPFWPTGVRVRLVRVARARRPVDPPGRPPHLLRKTERCAAEALHELCPGADRVPAGMMLAAPRRSGPAGRDRGFFLSLALPPVRDFLAPLRCFFHFLLVFAFKPAKHACQYLLIKTKYRIMPAHTKAFQVPRRITGHDLLGMRKAPAL